MNAVKTAEELEKLWRKVRDSQSDLSCLSNKELKLLIRYYLISGIEQMGSKERFVFLISELNQRNAEKTQACAFVLTAVAAAVGIAQLVVAYRSLN